MIARFNREGNLPVGIHKATWPEFCERFGDNKARKKLIKGMQNLIKNLKSAGCKSLYVDGSFVTSKQIPNDYDACWDIDGVNPNQLDPLLIHLKKSGARESIKVKYGGDIFPASIIESVSGKIFLDFFQVDRETDGGKGIILLNLERLN